MLQKRKRSSNDKEVRAENRKGQSRNGSRKPGIGSRASGNHHRLPGNRPACHSEVYGKGINADKQYTASDQKGFRVFDIVIQDEIDNILARELSAIASWRDNGGQSFVTIDGHLLASLADGLFSVPSLTSQEYRDMPKTLVETYEWLQQFKTTRAGMEDGHKGNAEGVVIRNENRSFIRKIRFEDYERTKRAGGF